MAEDSRCKNDYGVELSEEGNTRLNKIISKKKLRNKEKS